MLAKLNSSKIVACCLPYYRSLTAALAISATLLTMMEMNEAVGVGSETKIVGGLGGKEVEIKNPIGRIVTIPMPSASMFVSVDGKTDRLVGMHERSKEALLDGILGEFYPQAKSIASDITKEGFIPNIENIMRLYPDVVVQWESMPKTFKGMENAGLKVAAFVRYNNEELAYKNLRLVARILGQENKQEKLIAWRKETEMRVRARAEKIMDADKKSVVWILYYKKGLTVSGPNTYNQFFFEMAGGRLLVSKEMKRWPKIDMEQLLQWDPDVIIIGNFDPLKPADVYTHPQFSSLKAVKNKRVYKMPLGGYRWAPANQESPLAWMWSYNLLNPGKDPFDLRKEIREKYMFIYGKEPTEEQIDHVLHLDLNRQSADYAQFEQK